jgi:starch-binding outer membrane protein, SusD/RagB family
MKIQYKLFIYFVCAGLIAGCKKLVEVDPPIDKVTNKFIYSDNSNAAAVLTGIYYEMSPYAYDASRLMALSADEFNFFNNGNVEQFSLYTNNLSSSYGTSWASLYSFIYRANAAIEGLSASGSLLPDVKNQLLGEAKFIRAFNYFYLVNLYGDVPLVVNTDYAKSALMARTESDKVYEQIATDLKEAQILLNPKYLGAFANAETQERLRPNKYVADALLARVYLYMNNWVNAETEASKVIENSSLYFLPGNPDSVFLKNNTEAIWQFQPTIAGINTLEGYYFYSDGIPNNDKPYSMSDLLYNDFEVGDKRAGQWIHSVNIGGQDYHYAYKYKVQLNTEIIEYSSVLRLAEQYLIRAEARIRQNKITDGINDINVIRSRARGIATIEVPDPLPALSTSLNAADALAAVMHEKRIELFSEWGHRWLDLKRTGEIDNVMETAAPLKGGSWQNTDALFPIPQFEIDRAPGLAGHQNPGY